MLLIERGGFGTLQYNGLFKRERRLCSMLSPDHHGFEIFAFHFSSCTLYLVVEKANPSLITRFS